MGLSCAARIDLEHVGAPDDLEHAYQHAHAVRRRLFDLKLVPDGAKVIVEVGGSEPCSDGAWSIREHVDRLDIQIEGSPRSVRAWRDAVLGDGPYRPMGCR